MCRKMLAALLTAVALCAGIPAAGASDGAEILLLVDGSSGGKTGALCEMLTYMNRSFDCAYGNDDVPLYKYERVIVSLSDGAQLPEALAQALLDSKLPVMVIGQGGLAQLSGSLEESTDCFAAWYDFDGQIVRWLSGELTLRLPQRWDRTYGGKIGLIGGREVPLCAKIGNVTAIAWFDEAIPSMRAAVSSLLAAWMWPYRNAPPQYGSYLVLADLYPFDDAEILAQATDSLFEMGVPYALCVMPVYDNGHYPAMRAFCEFLRYEQARGASIVLRTPLSRVGDAQPGELRERIELAYEVYAQYGVYPVALAAPESYLQTEEGLSVLRGVSTVLLFETDEAAESPGTNLAYADGHTLIAPACPDGPYIRAYSAAVYLDPYGDPEALYQTALAYRDGAAPLRSLGALTNALYIGAHSYIAAPGQAARFDGELVSFEYIPSREEESYDYERGFARYLTDQVKTGNRFLLTMVFTCAPLFIALIAAARRRMRREFLVKKNPQKEGERL